MTPIWGFQRAFGRSLGLLCTTPILIVTAYATLGDQETHTENLEPREDRIVSLVEAWFTSLPEVAAGADDLEAFVVASPFEVSLVEGDLADIGEFRAWVTELRGAHPQVEYQIRDIRVGLLENGSRHARFEVDRRGVDDEGAMHLTRRRMTWHLRDPGSGPLVLEGVEEERLILFPGTGPQIVCF
jgi:hypothetical protein